MVETSPPPSPLSSLTNLFQALNQKGLRYCSWKGNYRAGYALAGVDDIDFHIRPSDFDALRSLLSHAGYRLATTPSNALQPGVFHYMGNDDETGKLINLHVYTRILTGDHMLKTWVFPFSDFLLNDTDRIDAMSVCNRSAELAVFMVRSMLKYTTVYDCYRSLTQSDQRIEELEWILDGADIEVAYRSLAQALPEIDRPEFDRVLILLRNAESTVLERVTVGARWAWLLRKYRRLSWLKQARLTGMSMLRMLTNRIVHNQKHMWFLGGGRVIALIGPQAVGKSTLGNAARDWLGEELSVQLVHVGKPPRTLLTWLPSKLIPMFKRMRPEETTIALEAGNSGERATSFPLSYVVRKLMLAWERQRLLRRTFRRAGTGGIVITDRYPSDAAGAIDSPSFDLATVAAEPSKLKRTLMNWELRLYSLINAPDFVIELRVPVDEAIQRNIGRDKVDKQSNEYVAARHAQVITPIFERCETVALPTDKPLEESILEIKRIIWARL